MAVVKSRKMKSKKINVNIKTKISLRHSNKYVSYNETKSVGWNSIKNKLNFHHSKLKVKSLYSFILY
jgi:hypothetical protein